MKSTTRAGTHHQFVPEQIIAITANTNYSYFHLITGERVHKSGPVLSFARLYPNFLRIHKSALINPQYVGHFSLPRVNHPNGYVMMKNDLLLEVARRRVQHVSQVLITLYAGR